jgi:hypothetical protein
LATFLPVFDTMKLTIPAHRLSILILPACSLIFCACSGLLPTPTRTPTNLPSDTVTPTTVWFPPTDTPTVLPPQPATPTPEYHPGVGELIFTDPFNQPAEWDTASSALASAEVTRKQLILSITGAGPLTIISRRSGPVLGDFYAEATVDISLCGGKDTYGMLFRASSGEDYYRVTLTCGGQARGERIRAGESYPLNEWLTSSDVPIGAPGQVKLGVWAAGKEMRVFLNDHYQFDLLDPVFSEGSIGFFGFAGGQDPLTVSFSDLSVYSVSYIPPTPSPFPTPSPAPPEMPSVTPNP